MTNTGPRLPRERVVLAHRHGAPIVRTRVEIEQQTQVGDALVRGLVRAQLGLALRLAAVVACGIIAIPLLNSIFPELSAVTLFGIRLNWLTLTVLVPPLLYAVGRLYVRLSEQGERDFVRIVDEEP